MGISELTKADANRLINALPFDAKEDFEAFPDRIEHRSIMLLNFSDGKEGAIVVYGQHCYFSVIAGDKALEFFDWEPFVNVRDIADFGAENNNESTLCP